MCGLTAIFAYNKNAPPIDVEELFKISDYMQARGPDGEGSWISNNNRVGFAHKRLAIIDTSSNGAQPMILSNGRGEPDFVITYNGEIYNYISLRNELIDQGHQFKTKSDTEVLLHLYSRYGENMLERLRGMYAFAIWDLKRQGIFLARDPFGIKPLYYADDGLTVRVASQVKALKAGGGIEESLEPAGHVGFFLLGYVPEPYTLYSNIKSLQSGTSLWVGKNGIHTSKRFFDVKRSIQLNHNRRISGDKFEYFRDSLLESVKHHLIADVPVGIFLSSGLDSATVTGLASETTGTSLKTMTLQFKELIGGPMDEAPLAEQISTLYGSSHQTRTVVGAEFEKELGSFFSAMDQPSIDGINTYFVAKEAADLGLKVALSGLGGDELFAGYQSFSQVPMLVNGLSWLPGINNFGKLFRVVTSPLFKRFTSPKYSGLFEYGGSYGGAYLLRRGLFMPWELPEVMEPEFAAKGWEKLELMTRLDQSTSGISKKIEKVSSLELLWYMQNQLLRDSDWAGMAHSLEIRTPLVDSVFFDKVVGLGFSKLDMARTPIIALPNSVLQRPKTGFYFPVREWLSAGPYDYQKDRGYRGWAKVVYSSFSESSL